MYSYSCHFEYSFVDFWTTEYIPIFVRKFSKIWIYLNVFSEPYFNIWLSIFNQKNLNQWWVRIFKYLNKIRIYIQIFVRVHFMIFAHHCLALLITSFTSRPDITSDTNVTHQKTSPPKQFLTFLFFSESHINPLEKWRRFTSILILRHLGLVCVCYELFQTPCHSRAASII